MRGEHREGCALCRLAQSFETPAAMAGSAVAYVDGEVVLLIDPGVPGVLVAPCSHVSTLSMTTGPAAVLAAVRKAALHVEGWYEPARAAIDAVTDMPGAAGHVCYRVVPSNGASPDGARARGCGEPAAQARHLADMFRAPSASAELHLAE